MRLAIFCVVFGILFSPSTHAGYTPMFRSVMAKLASPHVVSVDEDFVNMRTRYGSIQYRLYGSEVLVEGEHIYENMSVDRLASLGYFKLKKMDVVLFEGANLGSGGANGESFFLLLTPDLPPRIVKTRIGPLVNPITKVWRRKEVIFVDFERGEYQDFRPPLKLVDKNVVMTRVAAVHGPDFRPSLKPDHCRNIYEIAKNSCTKMSEKTVPECAMRATSKGLIGDSNAESGLFNWLAEQRGFSEFDFNQTCQMWCDGVDVTYQKFSSLVCSIK